MKPLLITVLIVAGFVGSLALNRDLIRRTFLHHASAAELAPPPQGEARYSKNSLGVSASNTNIDGCDYIICINSENNSLAIVHAGNCRNPIHEWNKKPVQ